MESKRFFVYLQDTHSQVTGSGHYNNAVFPSKENTPFLVDCGSFFGEKFSKEFNASFPFNPEKLNFCIITHSHLDHVGRLPMLSSQGFSGKYFCSEPTKVLLPYSLEDNNKINSNKKGKRSYGEQNLENVLKNICALDFNVPTKVSENITVTLIKNGHLPGASSVLVQIQNPIGGQSINILYSGDYSPSNMFFNVPEIPEWIRELPLTVVIEATYGDKTTGDIKHCFADNLVRAIEEDKIVVCPTNSLGRSQDVLYTIRKLQNEIPILRRIAIRQDGVLSFKYNSEYFKNTIGIDEENFDFLPFNFSYVQDQEERCRLITSKGPKIIVCSSGNGDYGSSNFYLQYLAQRSDVMVHFTSYLTSRTTGRRLIEAEKGTKVIGKFGGKTIIKRAETKFTSEFSKHARSDELISFLKKLNVKSVLINHGDIEVKETFRNIIIKEGIAEKVEILDRSMVFVIGPQGIEKSFPSKV